MKLHLRLALALALTLTGAAQAAWTTQGRTIERSSTSRTDTAVAFTLLPGEDPVTATLDCVRATRAAYPRVTWVNCLAYTPQGFAKRSGKVRPCYAVIVHWFADDGGMLRLYLPPDDREYPRSCPAT
ncbi:hypothetical protein [Deinococcus pimensis]|uniref:hypothetical protein n=1 Tax=Deinococcus pimensis TaxID=309888 RepID=UPI0004858A63|nr:hypothetical protein [Deinococcus pimensis]